MEDNIFHKLIDKMKTKMQKRKQGYPSVSEYAFSPEEIANLNEQNKQKIQDLKQESFPKIKKVEKKEISISILEQSVPKQKEVSEEHQQELKEEIIEQKNVKVESISEPPEEDLKELPGEKEEVTQKNSFIHLSQEHQELVMNKWNSIDNNEIDKDIIEGKDLLNHNYTITYADASAKYIHNIRKKYEIVLCYLIGFNNEKKGIYDKTIFSDKIDNEWKFLSNYIKLLEKIRNFKK